MVILDLLEQNGLIFVQQVTHFFPSGLDFAQSVHVQLQTVFVGSTISDLTIHTADKIALEHLHVILGVLGWICLDFLLVGLLSRSLASVLEHEFANT